MNCDVFIFSYEDILFQQSDALKVKGWKDLPDIPRKLSLHWRQVTGPNRLQREAKSRVEEDFSKAMKTFGWFSTCTMLGLS